MVEISVKFIFQNSYLSHDARWCFTSAFVLCGLWLQRHVSRLKGPLFHTTLDASILKDLIPLIVCQRLTSFLVLSTDISPQCSHILTICRLIATRLTYNFSKFCLNLLAAITSSGLFSKINQSFLLLRIQFCTLI